MNTTSELPPLIQIAFDEKLWELGTPEALREKLLSSGLEQELSRQAQWTLDQFPYVDNKNKPLPSEFAVSPSGVLNPFSKIGKCIGESCSITATNSFIRTVGLYADVAVIPDPLSTHFLEDATSEPWRDIQLYNDLRTLRLVAPLVDAHVLRFGAPRHRYCSQCYGRLENTLGGVTETLVSSIHEYRARVERWKVGPVLLVQIPILQPDHSHPLDTIVKIGEQDAALLANIGQARTKRSKRSRTLVKSLMAKALREELHSCFFELESSRMIDSLLLAGSRSEVLVINALEKAPPSLSDIENWEAVRTIDLPWIERLTADEVLQLRDEADLALPRLRELLRQRLVDPAEENTDRLKQTVAELRSQAFEVESELAGLELKKERKYRLGMAGLATSFVIYGIATQSPAVVATSLTALLATLAHLRLTERSHDEAQGKLTSSPAYALMKAKQILRKRT